MEKTYYRVTFEGRGYFSAVHDLIDYLSDYNDERDMAAYYDITDALWELETDLYCPDKVTTKAIYAYTEEGYRRFRNKIDNLSDVLAKYDFEKLMVRQIEPGEIVFEDKDQIAYFVKGKKRGKDMLVDYCFELENGEYVFVEMEDKKNIDDAWTYLQSQVDCEVVDYCGTYSVEEAEEIGYDTY